jgi:hypothetical protein
VNVARVRVANVKVVAESAAMAVTVAVVIGSKN